MSNDAGMSNDKAVFRQADIVRMLKAILKFGLQIYGVKALPQGEIEVSTTRDGEGAPVDDIMKALEQARLGALRGRARKPVTRCGPSSTVSVLYLVSTMLAPSIIALPLVCWR